MVRETEGGSPLSWATLAVLLLTHSLLLAYAAFHDSPTTDEVAHLPSGLSHLASGDFSLYRVNPPLVRSIAAIPITVLSPAFDWEGATGPELVRIEFTFGKRFCELNRERILEFFAVARLACIPLSLLGCVVVFLWSRELFGPVSAVVSASLWCFSPSILAHGHLVTPDVGATSFGIATCYAFAKWLRRPTWPGAWLTGTLFGLSVLCKLTWLLLGPLLLFQWLVFRRSSADGGAPPRARQATQMLAIVLMVLLVVNHFYGWKGSFTPIGEYRFASRSLSGSGTSSNRFRGTPLAGCPVPVPKDFLQGADLQKRDFEDGAESYLRGEIRHGGWWWYYLYGLAVKTPVGTIALVMLGTLAFAWRHGGCRVPSADVWILVSSPIALLVMVSSQMGFNHHVRYVLPALPFLHVWAGQSVRCARFGQWGCLCWLVPLSGTILGSMWVYPHSISYFNILVGGPTRGHYHLVDSNIDWGQDLLDLKKWFDGHPQARPFHLASTGLFDPRLAGVDFSLPPSADDMETDAPTGSVPPDGWYAVSVHRLHGLRRVAMADGKGKWVTPGDYTYFQRHTPCDRVGYSYLIYNFKSSRQRNNEAIASEID